MDQSIDNMGSTSNQSSSDFSREGLAQKARDAKNRVTDMMNEMEIPPEIEERLQALREQTQEALDRTEELVKRHPFYSILGAAAVGALVASFFGSRSSAVKH